MTIVEQVSIISLILAGLSLSMSVLTLARLIVLDIRNRNRIDVEFEAFPFVTLEGPRWLALVWLSVTGKPVSVRELEFSYFRRTEGWLAWGGVRPLTDDERHNLSWLCPFEKEPPCRLQDGDFKVFGYVVERALPYKLPSTVSAVLSNRKSVDSRVFEFDAENATQHAHISDLGKYIAKTLVEGLDESAPPMYSRYIFRGRAFRMY